MAMKAKMKMLKYQVKWTYYMPILIKAFPKNFKKMKKKSISKCKTIQNFP